MPPTWNETLSQQIKRLKAESNAPLRIAVVGVGNLLRSDDAAGVFVARALAKLAATNAHVLLIEAGQAPENWTGELRTFAPDLIIFIDAADLGGTPGTVHWIAEEKIDGMSASTHSLPLSILAHYLKLELDCKVLFLGIQIDSNEMGEQVSSSVLRAVTEVVEGLDPLLRDLCAVYEN